MQPDNGEAPDTDTDKDGPPFLRFRLTYIDTVQSSPLDLPPPPTPLDRSTPFIPARRIPFAPAGKNWAIDRVPELRIFGATEAGQRCCVHVHGALPYVYLEYEGKVAPEEIHNHINRLARAINICMAAALGRKDPSKSLFVAFIVPVKAIPFYGFHVGYRYYLKIYCLDPKYMTRMATLLRSGEIMKKRWIVYESHIPFLLQFMLDANIYGCGWVDVSKVKFREPVPDDPEPGASGESSESSAESRGLAGGQGGFQSKVGHAKKPKFFTRSAIPSSMLYDDPEQGPSRISHSALEFDIHVAWIQNRHLIQERNLHSDFTEFLQHPIPDDFKFVQSVRELWEDERRRRRMKGVEGPMEVSENSAEELLAGLTAGPRSVNQGEGSHDPDARLYGIGTQPPWQKFNENKARFNEIIEKDRLAYASLHPQDPIPRFDTFVKKEKKGGWMEKIQTSFQSVEALFEETLERDERTGNPFGAWAVRGLGVSVYGGSVSIISASEQIESKEVAQNSNEEEHDDVSPHYLALLGTQAGRARLAQLAEEDTKIDIAVDAEFDDAAGELHQHSDEEELNDQDEKRDMQEEARKKVFRQGIGRKEAWEGELALHNIDNDNEDDNAATSMNVPPNGQRLATRRSRSAESGDDSTRSRSASDEDATLLPAEPDIALLDQLVPVFTDEDGQDHSKGSGESTTDVRPSPTRDYDGDIGQSSGSFGKRR